MTEEQLFADTADVLGSTFRPLRRTEEVQRRVGDGSFDADTDEPQNWQGECQARLSTLIEDELRPACRRCLGILEFLVSK